MPTSPTTLRLRARRPDLRRLARTRRADLPRRIVEAFGGLTKMSEALGYRNVTTIDSWQRKGSIPPWRWREIEEAAERLSIKLPHDFPSAEEAEAKHIPPATPPKRAASGA